MLNTNSPLPHPPQISRNSRGQTPLHAAAKEGKTGEIQRLLKLGHKSEVQDLDGHTPLHLTAIQGYVEAARVLLEEGSANPLALTHEKESSFHLAASAGNLGLIQLFDKQVPSRSWLEMGDNDGKTCLHRAVWLTPKPELVAYLLCKGAVVNGRSKFGYTALHWAAKHGHIQSACHLLEEGAALNAKNTNGDTPLDLAICWGQDEAAHLLLNWETGTGHQNQSSSHSSTSSDNTATAKAPSFQFREKLEQYHKLKSSSDPQGMAYRLFEEAYETGKTLEQIFWLDRLAQLYIDRKEYLQAAHLLNGALAIAQDAGAFPTHVHRSSDQEIVQVSESSDYARKSATLSVEVQPTSNTGNQINPSYTRFLLSRLERIEGLFLYQLTGRNTPANFRGHLARYRATLKDIRTGAKRRLEGTVSIQRVQEFITTGYQSLLCTLIRESIALLGEGVPKGFAVMALGSMARGEACPYSDVEFAFLIDDASKEKMGYFEKLDQLLTLKMINMGETKHELIRPKRVDQVMRHAKSLTPTGFSMDIGGLCPSGRQGVYKLTGTPEELAGFQTDRWAAKHEAEIILVNAMTTVSCLMGNEDLVAEYQQRISQILDGGLSSSSSSTASNPALRKRRALELMRGYVEEFQPRLDDSKLYGRDARGFDVKKELYRLPQTIISALALYYGVSAASTHGRIDALSQKKELSETGADQLKRALASIFELRIKTHLFYKNEKEILYQSKEKKDQQAEGLFMITPRLQGDINDLYRLLIPLKKVADAFLRGDHTAFARASFHDSSLGAYDKRWRQELQFGDALRSSQVQAVFNPSDTSAHWDLGLVQQDLGKTRMALQSHKEVAILLKNKHGSEPHINVANNLLNMGIDHYALSSYSASVECLSQALSMYRTLSKKRPTNQLIANCLTGLGNAYRALGEFDKALDYHKKSLSLNQKHHKNKPHIAIAYSLSNLSTTYNALSEFAKAVECATSSLRIRETIHGNKPHPSVASSLGNLGNAYESLGEYPKAIAAYSKALMMCRAIYGKKQHPAVAHALSNLGNCHHASGNSLKATQFHGEALKLFRSFYTNDSHSDVASSLLNLGAAYRGLGNSVKAANCYQKALSIFQKLYNHNAHVDIAATLVSLGNCALSAGHFAQAIDFQNQALVIYRKIYNGSEHRKVAECLSNLGLVYHAKDDHLKAIRYFVQTLQIYRKIYGTKPHSDVADTLVNCANVYSMAGMYPNAGACYEMAVKIYKEIYGTKPNQGFAHAMLGLGLLNLSLGRTSKAIECYSSSYDLLLKSVGPNHPDVARVLSAIKIAKETLPILKKEANVK